MCQRFETRFNFYCAHFITIHPQEIFKAIDISKRGFVFLRDVVEVLRYIKEDSSLDQVRMKSLTLLCPKLNGLGNYITFETL